MTFLLILIVLWSLALAGSIAWANHRLRVRAEHFAEYTARRRAAHHPEQDHVR